MNSKFTMIVRILLGIILVVFGSNKFLHFIPMPPPPGSAGEFMNTLGTSGYFFPMLGIVEVWIGLMLLFKQWVPFGIILLAPISLNILFFHVCFGVPGVWVAVLVLLLNAVLIYKHWKLYRPLFT
jgi:putative oxidoreductase